ncbi:hypothetical protein [Acinetobacter modestus]|uniref:hypothetical protein n=1 Tax=Acinetobacter modestus TaxID=1776740 RepID=UPI00301B6AA4
MRQDIKIFTSLSFLDFITFYKKDSFHNNFIAKNIINRLNKINLMDGINFDCNTNTIFFKTQHGERFLDLEDKPLIRELLKLFIVSVACIAYPVRGQKKRVLELANSCQVVKIKESSMDDFENYIEEISNSIIGDMCRELLDDCIHDGWLYVDQKMAAILFYNMPVIVDRIILILELESNQCEKEETFLGKIISSYNYRITSSGGMKKAENAKIKTDPIRKKAIEMYQNPKQSNREKWKSRNEFSQYFCMKHNVNIQDENKWIKDSTVNKWIKDFLENG